VEKDIHRQANPVEVVVAAVPIAVGEAFVEGNLAKKAVPPPGRGNAMFPAADFELLLGARSKTAIDPGEPVLWTDVEEPYRYGCVFQNRSSGRRALTLGVDTESSFAGMLHPGDRVDLLVETSGAGSAGWISDIPVIAVDRDHHRLAHPSDKTETSTVTLMVTPGEGRRIARATGKVRWFLRNPEDNIVVSPSPRLQSPSSLGVEIWKGGRNVTHAAVAGEVRELNRLLRAGRIVAAISLFLSITQVSVSMAVETIRIRQGFQQVLERHGVSRLSIGNPRSSRHSRFPEARDPRGREKGGGNGPRPVGKRCANGMARGSGSRKGVDRPGCPFVRRRLPRVDRLEAGRSVIPHRHGLRGKR